MALFSEHIRERIADLPPTIRKVAQYIGQNRVAVLGMSALEIASALDTSDATVVRTAKALGFEGLVELKKALARELSVGTPVDNFKRTLTTANADARKAVEKTLQSVSSQLEDNRTPEALDAMENVLNVLAGCERLVFFGLGPSTYLAEYAAFQLRRQGRRTGVLSCTGRHLADEMLDLSPGDGLILISYSEPYAEALAVVEDALVQTLPVVLITNKPDHRLRNYARQVLVVQRGGGLGMALNASTFIYLEALIVGLAVRTPEKTRAGLSRLEMVRQSIDRLR